MKTEIKTKWQLFRCENGRQWSEPATASYYPEGNKNLALDGSTCNFSGCLSDHKIHRIGEPTEHVPADWFKGWPIWEETPQYKNCGKEAI